MADIVEEKSTNVDKTGAGKYDDVVIESEQLGVYRVLVATTKATGFRFSKSYEEMKTSMPYLVRLFTDIHGIAPGLFACYLFSQVWSGLEDALLMHFSTRMLRAIELGFVKGGKPLTTEILISLGLRILCTALVGYLSWLNERFTERLQSRVTSHFDLYLMKVKAGLDLPTSLDASSQIDMTGNSAWHSFSSIISFFSSIIQATSQTFIIYNEARNAGGPAFVLVCLAKPLFSNLTYRALWEKAFYAYVNNEDYLRMSSLKKLTETTFREDVLSGDLNAWIVQEYQTARDKVGEASARHPLYQYEVTKSPIIGVTGSVLSDLPMAYCAINAILFPARFSVASIAILQSSSTSLRWSLSEIFQRRDEFWKNVNNIKELYSLTHIENKVVNGQLAYPASEKSSREGMAFDLRDLSFAYPGSHKKTNALDKINLKIPGGSLIVIVGGNGSGKSTLVRILSRLFDPTSGDLFIDDHPARDYNIVDLRRSSTLLSQDNKIYPLSFAENIGLGCLDCLDDMDMIRKAAEQGGAAEFIGKLETGYNTVLDNEALTTSMNLIGHKEHPLNKEMEKLEKKVNISGGETQRLVAARSFMRLNSGKVKYIAVDEPSSALDAEGELDLFNRLLEVREGKTMIFVTHRFGHLTKHADIIICMKDGAIAETGSHEELLGLGGEYAKLYKIQANAFLEGTAPTSVS